MKHFFIFTLTICSLFISAQKKQLDVQTGIYTLDCGEGGNICGDWIIKADSSFVFLKFDKYKDWRLTQFGRGKWKISDDQQIYFEFIKAKVDVLSNSKIIYSSETKGDYDSIYIKGRITDEKNVGIGLLGFRLSNNYTLKTDSQGYFNAVFLRNVPMPNLITLSRDLVYAPFEFELSKNNNYHTLNITIASKDSGYSMEVYNTNPLLSWKDKVKYPFKQLPGTSPRSYGLGFRVSTFEWAVHMLLEAQKKQPYLESNIKELIELINN